MSSLRSLVHTLMLIILPLTPVLRPILAYAISREPALDTSIQLIEQERRESNQVTLNGRLQCGEKNGNSSNCAAMIIREMETGKSYKLGNNGEAELMLRAGHHNVAIEGVLQSNGEIDVTHIQAL